LVAAAPATPPVGEFLKGAEECPAEISSKEKALLAKTVAALLKRHWSPQNGLDDEKLVSIVRWDLNPDGSLARMPILVKQMGITEQNRQHAARHAELAIRAVRLASPFPLDHCSYAAWKRITFRFDSAVSVRADAPQN
jgi:hypothetical protein